MIKIKIISNPYKKETRFQKWDQDDSIWAEIDYDSNPNSKLLNHDLTTGFFPFRAKKIVDFILDEYGVAGEILELYFEGSMDEFKDLEAVCAYDKYSDKIKPFYSNVFLENARDILPEVRNLFREMSPLIAQSVSQDKIKRDLSRFTDASSDVVPICVLGNYSAGKSTFINALIGNEILPSGTEPITAKVYKISKSVFPDRAKVKCQYLGYDIVINFSDTETSFEGGIIDSELTSELKTELAKMRGEKIAVRVNKALSILNEYERDTEQTEISDLISVEIPFINGILAKSLHPVVIFDTPGSNSASNAKHLMVLKEAMANMTNGLPIFLCTPDSLDSTDNENLYHIIHDMDELDSRFTMIVVNKADSAGIQRRGSTAIEQNRILSQSVPRNLYSGGLFYVSSILGLGAKTDGTFVDYVYEDIYDAQVERYENPNHKHYRTLYLFNIQPEQLKQRADDLAACQDELVYSNSGLFTIENEIETFAGKYSAYNKCFQSQLFLNKVIQITAEEIQDKKEQNEGIRQSIKDKLESDKKVLTEKIESASAEHREEFIAGYPTYMTDFLEGTDETFSVNDLKQQEELFTKEHESDVGFDDKASDAKKARDSLTGNLKSNIVNAVKLHNKSAFKEIVDDLQSDYRSAKDTLQTQINARHQVDQQAASSLLKYVTDKYEMKLEETYSLLDSKSREYWTDKTELLRDVLAQIVSGSDVLTETRRKELEKIIITYQQLSFREDSAETIFDRVNFERRIRIGNQVLWQSDHLNIEKLAKTYNTNIVKGAEARYQTIEASHRDSAFEWIQNLLDEIYENIVEYSPELSKQAKQIRIMTERIEELESHQKRLSGYTEQLRQMMDWKVKELV